MLRQRTRAPGVKLLGERLVEPTDGAADFERLPAGFERLPPRMSRAGARHKHLGQLSGDVRF